MCIFYIYMVPKHKTWLLSDRYVSSITHQYAMAVEMISSTMPDHYLCYWLPDKYNSYNRPTYNMHIERNLTSLCNRTDIFEYWFSRLYLCIIQQRIQNVEKVTHVKGRLLKQAVFFSIITPLINLGNSLKRKNLLPMGANSFL